MAGFIQQAVGPAGCEPSWAINGHRSRASSGWCLNLVMPSFWFRSSHQILDQVGIKELTTNLQALEAKDADVGITGCEGAIAATGSVGFSSHWGRLAALLPYHHIVVMRADQLVPDLEDWYLKLSLTELPGAWGMHTGPSKSADIEQTMALGVHGPGKVDVILLLEEAAN